MQCRFQRIFDKKKYYFLVNSEFILKSAILTFFSFRLHSSLVRSSPWSLSKIAGQILIESESWLTLKDSFVMIIRANLNGI